MGREAGFGFFEEGRGKGKGAGGGGLALWVIWEICIYIY